MTLTVRRVIAELAGLFLAVLATYPLARTFPPVVFWLVCGALAAGLMVRERAHEKLTFAGLATLRLEAALGAAVVAWFVRFEFTPMALTTALWVALAALPPKIRDLSWLNRVPDFLRSLHSSTANTLDRLPWPVPGLAAAALVAWPFLTLAPRFWPQQAVPFAFWITAGLFCFAPLAVSRLLLSSPKVRHGDPLRIALVMLTAFLVLQPIGHKTLHGGGDAAWYATMLQDMLLQVRAGIFPVFGGQTEYQYSGVLYPIRIAPAFHYLGALTDLGTGRALDAISVQNLLLVLWGMVAAITTYTALARLLPHHRFLALIAALLFVTCPGVIAIAFFSDLYMSWMTVPLVPVVFAATALTFEQVTWRRTVVLGVALGALWWGHTPIALWTTLFASAFQVIRLIQARRRLAREGWPLLIGAGAFLLAASFPIVAATLYPAEPGAPVGSFQRANAANIVLFLREAIPGNFLPIDKGGRSLAGFQLGYGLWMLLISLVLLATRARQWVSVVFAGLTVWLMFWLIPWPGIAEPMWNLVPAFVRDTTGNWVMNRLYLVAASLVVVGIATAAPAWIKQASAARKTGVGALLVLLVGWSISEGQKFGAFSALIRREDSAALRALYPENVAITRFAYLVFPKLPGTFTHGATDPALEHRFLSDAGDVLWTNESRIIASAASGADGYKFQDLGRFGPGELPNQWQLPAPLALPPGARVLLQFDFGGATALEGVFQLKGEQLFREYGLPLYGGPLSFGCTPGSKNTVPLWSTKSGGDQVKISLFASGKTTPEDIIRLRIRSVLYPSESLPIRVLSWLPYRVEVDSPEAGWVETPRAYQVHWKRTDGGPLKKSAEGLLAFRHDGGKRTYQIEYAVPVGFVAVFWLSALTLFAGLIIVPLRLRNRFSV